MLAKAGRPVKDFGFTSKNQYAILVFELWMLLKNQAIYAFGVPKALDFKTVLEILKFYSIPEHLQKWVFEMLHFISSEIFSAIEEISYKETKNNAG